MLSENVPVALLFRLAQACETYLPASPLAQLLRGVVAQEESAVGRQQPPSLAEAAALAGALHRYLDSWKELSLTKGVTAPGGNLKEVAAQLENALAAHARREAAQGVAGLYVIVDPELTGGRDVVEVARAALRGGATAIQLRDKVHDKGVQLPVARRLLDLCHEYGGSFIVNDHADLAAACGAHGLHVGQHDLPIPEARRVLYPAQFVGTSNALVQEAEASALMQADYIAVGAMYPTGSKGNTRPAGIQGLRQVRQRISGIAIVAIGGITLDNVGPVLEAGADGICVIGAVCQADDPEHAARLLVERIHAHRAAQPGGFHGTS